MTILSDIVGERVLKSVPKLDARHPFSTDATGVAFELDDTIYLVFEDESDGYRSAASPLFSAAGAMYSLNCQPDYIHEKVLCSHETVYKYGGENDVLCLRSVETGEVVFRVGTENVDDYYPSFVVEWLPQNLSANAKGRVA